MLTRIEGMLGVMGVDHSSSKCVTRDASVSLAVLRAVFRIFICHSMNPFDL